MVGLVLMGATSKDKRTYVTLVDAAKRGPGRSRHLTVYGITPGRLERLIRSMTRVGVDQSERLFADRNGVDAA